MKKLMRKKNWLLVALIILLSLMACEASDPLPEGFYTSDLTVVSGSSFTREDGYWHEYIIDAFSVSPGSSGATLINSNVSSLGGYQLNAIGEYLYFTTHMENDWDGVSNGVVQIWFEVNDDNSGGLVTDTVDLQLESYHKLLGEQTNTVDSLSGITVVGQAQQHDLFRQDISIINLRAHDVISFRINLNTISSEVVDIIVNYIEFKYPTLYPAEER